MPAPEPRRSRQTSDTAAG